MSSCQVPWKYLASLQSGLDRARKGPGRFRKGWRKRLYKTRRKSRLTTTVMIVCLEFNKRIKTERGDTCEKLVAADWKYSSEEKVELFWWDAILHV
jgi:hypothetical protein